MINAKISNWLHLGTLLHIPLKKSLIHTLHHATYGLPIIPCDLYTELDLNHRDKIIKLQNQKVLKKDQVNIILPENDTKTDIEQLDVSGIVPLITNCTTYPKSKTVFKDFNSSNYDNDILANALRAREWRNFLHHTDPFKFNDDLFEQKWEEGENIIKALGYNFDTERLKSANLDQSTIAVKEFLKNVEINNETYNKMLKEDVDNLSEQLKTIRDDFNGFKTDTVLTETLVLIAEYIEDDWLKFAHDLHINKDIISDVTEKDLSNKDKMLECFEKDHKKFSWKKLQQNLIALNEVNSNQMVHSNILKLVAKHIDTNWLKFAQKLKVSHEFIKKLLREEQESVNTETEESVSLTNQDKIMRCFKDMKCHVTWKVLKGVLIGLSKDTTTRSDAIIIDVLSFDKGSFIIDQVRKRTYIKMDNKTASDALRNLHKGTKEQDHLMGSPFNNTRSQCLADSDRKNNSFVKLAIVDGESVTKDWSNKKRDFHMRQKHLRENKFIELGDILLNRESLVCIRGIAGIGKTTSVNEYIQYWAYRENLNGEKNHPDIAFLFKLSCRELNFKNKSKMINCVNDLLLTKYPTIFNVISLQDLHEMAHRVLIIIDGFDELDGLFQTNHGNQGDSSQDDNKFLQNVLELVNPNSTQFLPGHKTIITGRPEACMLVGERMESQFDKLIEVCGFDEASTDEYLKIYFENNKEIYEDVRQKINESDNLKVMASIPVYLWIICGIFSERRFQGNPKTTTQLMTFACLLFIRKHLKKENIKFPQRTLYNLCSEPIILKIIKVIACLSYRTLQNQEVVFAEELLQEVTENIIEEKENEFSITWELLEKTGFIVSYKDDIEGNFYQFRHLVLQEYFAALHIYMTDSNAHLRYDICRNNVSEDNRKANVFKTCIPLISGFVGAEEDKTKNISFNLEKQLLPSLRGLYPCYEDTKVRPCQRNTNSATDFEKHLQSQLSRLVHDNKIILSGTNATFLSSCIYEYQGSFVPSFVESIQKHEFSFNLSLHCDIRNMIHLVNQLNLNIKSFTITNTSNDQLPKHFDNVIQSFFKSSPCNTKIIKFSGSNKGMQIISNTVHTSMEVIQCVEVILPNQTQDGFNDGNLKHVDIIKSLIQHQAEQIVINYNLITYLPVVYKLINQYCGESMDYRPNITYMCTKTCFHENEHSIETYTEELVSLGRTDIKELHFDTRYLTNPSFILKKLRNHLHVFKNVRIEREISTLFMDQLSSDLLQCFKQHSVVNLKTLFLTRCSMDSIKHLLPAMSSFQSIQLKDIISNHDDDEPFNIAENTCVESILLRFIKSTDYVIKSMLPSCLKLAELEIAGNDGLTIEGLQWLSDFIIGRRRTFGNRLKVLRLKDCLHREAFVEAILPSLAYLDELELNGNKRLLDNSVKMIVESIFDNKTGLALKNLIIRNCDTTCRHMTEIIPNVCRLELFEIEVKRNTYYFKESLISLFKTILDTATKSEELNNPTIFLLKTLNIDIWSAELLEELLPCLTYLQHVAITIRFNKDMNALTKFLTSIGHYSKLQSLTVKTQQYQIPQCVLKDVFPCLADLSEIKFPPIKSFKIFKTTIDSKQRIIKHISIIIVHPEIIAAISRYLHPLTHVTFYIDKRQECFTLQQWSEISNSICMNEQSINPSFNSITFSGSINFFDYCSKRIMKPCEKYVNLTYIGNDSE